MDKKVYELLKDINSNADRINDWSQIINIFATEIRRKRLSKDEIEYMNERILREIRKR